eukprot:gene5335-9344_t
MRVDAAIDAAGACAKAAALRLSPFPVAAEADADAEAVPPPDLRVGMTLATVPAAGGFGAFLAALDCASFAASMKAALQSRVQVVASVALDWVCAIPVAQTEITDDDKN